MYKLKKLEDVSAPAKWMHAIALGLEVAMSIVSLGLFIHALVIGDPSHRSGPILSSVLVFLLPFCIEIIAHKRFPFLLHIAFLIHATLAIFVGSALDCHNTVEPYDEIMHFLFGYMAALYIYYFLISWKDYDRQKRSFDMLVILMASLGIACLWEISEFAMDVLFGQAALGIPAPEVVEAGKALGLEGINLAVYNLIHGVSVWDTVTDMSLHLGGTALFLVQFAIECHVHRPLMLDYIRKDYVNNKEIFYNNVEDVTLSANK